MSLSYGINPSGVLDCARRNGDQSVQSVISYLTTRDAKHKIAAHNCLRDLGLLDKDGTIPREVLVWARKNGSNRESSIKVYPNPTMEVLAAKPVITKPFNAKDNYCDDFDTPAKQDCILAGETMPTRASFTPSCATRIEDPVPEELLQKLGGAFTDRKKRDDATVRVFQNGHAWLFVNGKLAVTGEASDF